MNIDEYERTGKIAYGRLASTVAAILTAAIRSEGGYRLQQVTYREKQPASLRKKLLQREIPDTENLESDIKDLAGCRVVFYTNSDVSRLLNSGVVEQNFEVREVKIHHPRQDAEEATDLYMSNHYVLELRPDRLSLPEYADFSKMRCEVQIQTILNHAWAEMAHDTVYKVPELGDFGARQLDSIKKRLHKVARKYLVPAGYEFQQIAYDFERLVEGKALFDGDALEAIVEAADNNVRVRALETFVESVLPFYDDLSSVYSHVIDRLIAAADVARATEPVAIETPYGALPPKSFSDVVKAIAGVLERYRYVDLEKNLDALFTLYGSASTESERKHLVELGSTLARHDLHVWRQHGAAAQVALVSRILELGDEERRGLTSLLTAMLGKALESEVTGTTRSSSAVTFHRGSVADSDVLRCMRTRAIGLLKHQFALAEDEVQRREVLLALQTATRVAVGPGYSDALARLVMDDTCSVVSFLADIAPTLSLSLRQSTETQVHWWYRRYAKLPEGMQQNENLVLGQTSVKAAALAFRDIVNADADFVVYKVLVGYDCVYPPAWEDDKFQHAQAEAYRSQEVVMLLESVDAASADAWYDRLSRYASTDSSDLATFPVFGKFLFELAASKPEIVLGYLDKLNKPLQGFLSTMLRGLLASAEKETALSKIDGWLEVGQHVDEITWGLRYADPFDEQLLFRSMQSAIKYGVFHGVRNAVLACVDQFDKHPGHLIERVFLPSLRYLAQAQDFSWIRMSWVSWLNRSIIEELDEPQAAVVLEVLLLYPDLEHAVEDIVASIAKRWPGLVIDFLGQRQRVKRDGAAPADYDAIPFSVHELQAPLAAAVDLMLSAARGWFEEDPLHFTFDGASLLASVFPDMAHGLNKRIAHLIADPAEGDLAFVLAVLSAYEGKPVVYGHVRNVVAKLDAGDQLLKKASSVLDESGVVSGEFGFADLHAGRKALLQPWLEDESEGVRVFARSQIRILEQREAAEVRSAEASIALRRLQYGEDVEGADKRVEGVAPKRAALAAH